MTQKRYNVITQSLIEMKIHKELFLLSNLKLENISYNLETCFTLIDLLVKSRLILKTLLSVHTCNNIFSFLSISAFIHISTYLEFVDQIFLLSESYYHSFWHHIFYTEAVTCLNIRISNFDVA